MRAGANKPGEDVWQVQKRTAVLLRGADQENQHRKPWEEGRANTSLLKNVRTGQADSGAVQAEEQGAEKRAAKPEQAEAVTDKWRKKPTSSQESP